MGIVLCANLFTHVTTFTLQLLSWYIDNWSDRYEHQIIGIWCSSHILIVSFNPLKGYKPHA